MDGSLAAELTARLLKAGFTAELAARLVNVALALKSDEESGATLDLISVDLYTGTARIFKAGAAPGFLVHGGRARPVGDISLPIGILGGVNGQSRVVHLAAGDYAVLVSDGLLVDGPGWVAKQLELSAAAGDPPEKVARILVETARARAAHNHVDRAYLVRIFRRFGSGSGPERGNVLLGRTGGLERRRRCV